MKLFKVKKGSPALVCQLRLFEDIPSVNMAYEKLISNVRLIRARKDKTFTDGELVSDVIIAHNKANSNVNHDLTPIDHMVIMHHNHNGESLYAFHGGGWIAFYRANDVELVC